MSTHKEELCSVIDQAIANFEEETGVEVHQIKIDRVEMTNVGPSIFDTTTIVRFKF